MLAAADVEIFQIRAQGQKSPDKVPTPPNRLNKAARRKGMRTPFLLQTSLLVSSDCQMMGSVSVADTPGMHSVAVMQLALKCEIASALQKCRKWTRLWFSQDALSRKSPLTWCSPLLCSYTLSFMGEPFEVTLKHELFCLKICLLIWHHEVKLSWCNADPQHASSDKSLLCQNLMSKNQMQKSAGGMVILDYARKNPDLT
jgi:hypothetical protein